MIKHSIARINLFNNNHEDNGRLALVKRLDLSDFNGESHNIRFVDSNLNTSLQVLKYDNNQILNWIFY